VSREVARFLAREIARQTRQTAGHDFGTVAEVTGDGRAQVSYRGGVIEVNPVGVVVAGDAINLNRGAGLLQFDGNSMYRGRS